MKKTNESIRDLDQEIDGLSELIFNKVCKCGNEMGIFLSVDEKGYNLKVAEKSDYSHTCFMVGNSTVQCSGCAKRHRSRHKEIAMDKWREATGVL